MNVVPGKQSGLIGATLLQAMFDRSAYGCKLYCCLCAQDIVANKFWEAMGFVPLAFRAGSRTKGKKKTPRVHIFWQKRIRPEDVTTPWWFPSQTGGGSIREDRIVLPIPPGTHWSDAKPMVLPGEQLPVASGELPECRTGCNPAVAGAGEAAGWHPALRKKSLAAKGKVIEPPKRATIAEGGLRFADPAPAPAEKRKRAPKPKQKNDPRLIAAARELRDRWLEQMQHESLVVAGKYEISRRFDRVEVKMLEAA